MARSPDRVRMVFFLGAGFGKAAGLPNTAELLSEAHALSASSQHWGVSVKIGDRLDDAYTYFYPDHAPQFRPDVGDFFSVLSTYEAIAAEGLPQGFGDRSLLVDLKFAITRLLTQRGRLIVNALDKDHEILDQIIQPGNVVVTTNWDLLVEEAAHVRKIPLRMSGPPSDSSLVLLKLHGSIDWTLPGRRKRSRRASQQDTYAALGDLLFSKRAHRYPLQGETILRVRGALDQCSRAYQAIKAATQEPYMLTMARGKADLITPIRSIWQDAYRALSSARELHIIGYSMPAEDTEIRTLLRAGCKRGSTDPQVIVRNPAPDVHVRVRTQIQSAIDSDYCPVPAIC